MELVWVAPQLFAHPRSGGDLRSLRLLQALTPHVTVRVVVIGPCDDPELLRQLSGAAEVRVFPRLRRPVRARVIALRHGWPLYAARLWNGDAARWVGAHPGVLLVDHPWVLPYSRLAEGPVVLSLQNVEHLLQGARPKPRQPLRRLERWWEVRTTRRFEQAAVQDPRVLVLVVSDSDRALLGAGLVVPNGADLPGEVPPYAPDGPPLFVGSLDYEPNRLAVGWWVERVWPLLPAGSLPLTVVGRGGADALGRWAESPGVELVGEVPDVAPYLAKAGAVVVPLLHGGGSRLKVLEAFAWRRPVISTSKGVEGLPVADGEEVVLVDSPQDFAAALVQLRDDPHRVAGLVQRAHLVAEAHAWPVVAQSFVAAVVSLSGGDECAIRDR